MAQLPDKRIHPILKQYAEGKLSAMNAAYDIQALGLPGYDDPSASEVILWSKAVGYGIPSPTEDEARAEAEAFLKKHKDN